jgi:phosphate transport system substrate-binding protein
MLIMAVSCGPQKPTESMTAGHAFIGASDAVYDLAWQISRDFQTGNRGAFVDIVRADNASLVDSLLNRRTEQIFLDRTPTPAETLALQQAHLRLYQYPIALYPAYLLVQKSNPVAMIDSASFRDVLAGQITNWKQLGGKDERITPYIPRPGEGAWNSIMAYYGRLDSVEAVACSTFAQMVKMAASDSGALLVYAMPYENLPFKRLMFRRVGMDIPANPKTIAEEPLYPFRLDITYVTTRNKTDVAAGYLTYAMSNLGQRGIMNAGYRPASVPVRVVQLKG